MLKQVKLLLILILVFQTKAHSCVNYLDKDNTSDGNEVCIDSDNCIDGNGYLDKTNKICYKTGDDDCTRCGSDFFKVHGTLKECIDSTKTDCGLRDLTYKICYGIDKTSCSEISSNFFKVHGTSSDCREITDANCAFRDLKSSECYPNDLGSCAAISTDVTFFTVHGTNTDCQDKESLECGCRDITNSECYPTKNSCGEIGINYREIADENKICAVITDDDNCPFYDSAKCYSASDICTRSSNKFHLNTGKECLPDCSSYKYKVIENDKNECYNSDNCPSEYPKKDSGETGNGVECRTYCKSAKPFLNSDGICDIKCTSPSAEFYDDPATSGKTEYECKDSCNTLTHPFLDGKICKMKCPNEKPYFKDDKICIAECPFGYYYHDYGSFKCKSGCSSDYYIFNYICYPSCPIGTLSYTDAADSNKKKCKCLGKYQEEKILDDGTNSKTIITCLGIDAPCGFDKPYFDATTNKCIASVDASTCPFLRKISTSPVNYQCLTECSFDEYIYIINDKSYCVTECPTDKPYKYVIRSSNRKCIADCKGKYADENTKTCYETCPNGWLILFSSSISNPATSGDENVVLGKCYYGIKCPPTFPYFYDGDKKVCIDDCDSLSNPHLGLAYSSFYLDKETNECYTECLSHGKFILDKECVKYCKDYNNKYPYNGKCLDTCSQVSADVREVVDTHECDTIDNKNNYYLISTDVENPNKFYKNGCPEKSDNSAYYQDDSSKRCYDKPTDCPHAANSETKKCITCSVPQGNNLENEGYTVYFNEQATVDDKFCYKICPNGHPYLYDNKCYSTTDLNIDNYLRIDGTLKFVTVCPNGYVKLNKICYYSNCPENAKLDNGECVCSYNFYEVSSVKTCLALNEPCPNDYNYILPTKECKKKDEFSCSSSILRKTSNNPENYECLSSSSCEDNEFYYYENDDTSEFKICVTKCPNDFPYRDADGTEGKRCRKACVSTGSSSRYTNEVNHLCYTDCPGSGLNLFNPSAVVGDIYKGICISESSCPTTARYLFRNTKTCIDDCQKILQNALFGTITTIYLNEANNECITTCSSLHISSDEHSCVEQCPDKISTNNKCVDSCDYHYYVYETGQCLTDSGCESYQYKDSRSTDENYKYICYQSCPSNFWYNENTKTCYNNYDTHTYIVENTSKKVINNCSNYIYSEGSYKFCYEKCPDSAPYYYYEDVTNNKICVDKCSGNNKILIKSDKKCVSSESACTQGGILNNICYEKCPENTKLVSNKCDCVDKYYKRAIDESNSLIECLKEGDACPSSKPYLNGQECDKSCPSGTTYQREIIINGVINYECLRSCNSDEYKYSSVKCVSKCPEAAPYHVLLSDTGATGYDTNHRSCMTQSNCKTNNYFIDETNFICYDKCPGLATIDETHPATTPVGSFKPGKCVLGNDCPSSYPYLYGSFCLSDCSMTKKYTGLSSTSAVETILDETTKTCVKSDSCVNPKYYDRKLKKCVDKCRDDQYFYNTDCYENESCTDDEDSEGKKLIAGSHKCVVSCSSTSDYTYSLDNYCYSQCPENYLLEVDDDNKNCVTACSGGKYIINGTNECGSCDSGYYIDGANPSICYTKCPTSAPYYKSGVKKCYSSGCPVDTSDYIFLNPKTNECVTEDSCPAGSFKFNRICYSECPELTLPIPDNKCKCVFNYYIKNELHICLNEGEPCPSSAQYINPDGLCSSSCSSYIRSVSSFPVNYECVAKCNDDEFVYTVGTSPNEKKYCLKQCPEAAQYYIADQTSNRECKSKCSDFSTGTTPEKKYYTDEINHICYETCPSSSLSTIDESNDSKDKCIFDISCPTYKPYLYKNKYCFSNCASAKKSILGSDKADVSSTWIIDKSNNQCIEDSTKCKFKDEDGNCVENCQYSQYVYLDETNGNACYNKCPSPKYTVFELKQCVSDCKNVKYYSSSETNDYKCYKTCPSGYNTDDYNLKCYASGCSNIDGEAKILKVSYNKCLKSCEVPKNKNYLQIQEGYLYGDTLCLDKCPDDKPYNIKDDNECKGINDFTNHYRINGTNEFVAAVEDSVTHVKKCPSPYYLFNDICYTFCPENSEYDSTEGKCVCSFKKYTITNPTKPDSTDKYYVCLGPNEFCPKNKYVENNECVVSCTSITAKIRKISSNPLNYECTNSCNSDEFDLDDTSSNECLKECPETHPYHVFGETTCHASCTATTHYTDKVNHICYQKCPLLGIIDEGQSTLTKGECLQNSECPQGMYLYDLENVCLKKCESVSKFSITSTYSITDEEKKKCVPSCGAKYEDLRTTSGIIHQCLDACPEGSYIYQKTCLSSCPTDDGLSGKYMAETKVCITDTEASNYYHLEDDDFKYYESCPLKDGSGSGLYQNDVTHECKTSCALFYKKSIQKCLSSCTAPSDPDSLKEDEGFYKESDSTPKECLEKCDTNAPYYIQGENKCLTAEGVSSKYKIENTNIYTSTCPEHYYLFNKVCYKNQCPINTYYDQSANICKCSYKFKKDENGIYVCYSESQSCSSDEPYFDPTNGCVANCNIIKKVQTSISALSYECVTSCDFGEFEYDDGSLKFCVDKCPDDKKYHTFGKYDCRANCDPVQDNSATPSTIYYYTDNRDLTCREDCDGLKTLDESDSTLKKGECISGNKCPDHLILFAEKNMCLSKCSKTNDFTTNIFGTNGIKTYLHEGSIKQCLQDCSTMLTKRYTPSDTTDDVCVEKCKDTDFIYDYKCYSDCANVRSSNTIEHYIAETRECVENCNGYFTINSPTSGSDDSKKCFKECPEEDSSGVKLFIKEETTKCVKCTTVSATPTDEEGFYIENDSDRICYTSCPDKAKNHITGDNKCINGCTGAFPYIYEKMDGTDKNECTDSCNGLRANYECYSSNCPSGFKKESESSQKCICDTNKYYKSYDSNNNEILNCIADDKINCPADKPYLTDGKECVADCPSDYKIKDEEEKKCYESSCPSGKYLKVSINKCISDCKIPVNKGIIAEDEGYYITKVSSDTSQNCYDECPIGNLYHNIGENQCYSSCGGTKPNSVIGTNECVNDDECPEGYYLFNGLCYKDQCPENTEFNSVSLTCKCKYKFYETTASSGKYVCLSENEPCPQSNNYYDETKQCKNSCGGYLRKMSTDADDYQCLNECLENEFTYTDNSMKYCVETCPNSAAYHQENSKECIDKNSCRHFIDETNKICYDACPNLHTIDETKTAATSNTMTGECLQGNKCPVEPKIYYYYEKTKTCISSCSLTSRIVYLGTNSDITYTVSEPDPNDNTLRIFRCVSDCSTNVYKTLTDTVNKECVEICGENNGGKFLYNKKCYPSCGTGTGNAGLSTPLYLEDTKECVLSCPDGYYTESTAGICYKKCPNFSTGNPPVELFTQTAKKTCISCKNPIDSSASVESKGYKVFGDTTKTCYEKCPNTAPYYDSGNNICFDGGCRSSNNPDPTMLYSNYNDGSVEDYKCYTTCQVAVGGSNSYLMTEDYQCIKGTICPISYPYLYSGVCYKNKCPSDNMKITKKDGVYECKVNCNNNEYLQGKECVSYCRDDYPYKVKPDNAPGTCFTEEEKCSTTTYQYYNEDAKICRDTCSDLKIEIDSTTGRSKISIKGTCIPKAQGCPNDFPYLYDNTNTCYKSCPSIAPFIDEDDKFTCLANCASSTNEFEYNGNRCVSSCTDKKDKYYIEYKESETVTRKVCVNKCTSPQKYYFASNGKCLEECEAYYNPITFECVDSCSSVYGYQFYVANKPSACLSKCDPNTGYGYYYDSEKKCMSECDKYYSSADWHICVQSCGPNEFIIPEINKCTKSCYTDYPYQVTKSESVGSSSIIVSYCFSKCDGTMSVAGTDLSSYKFILNNNKKCTTKCEGEENYYFSGVCYSKCPDIAPYYASKSNYGTNAFECLSSCGSDYHNKNSYECISTCSGDNKYYIIGTYTCLDSCPDEYPYEITKTSVIECTDKCIINNNPGYITGKKCDSKCDSNYPYYVKTLNQCFNYCPSTFPFRKAYSGTEYSYECVNSCEGSFISDDECVAKCPKDKNYVGKNKICKAFCESDDGNYYSKMDPGDGSTDSYDVYTCSSQCNLGNYLYHTIREYECFTGCPQGALYSTFDNVCYSLCKENENYPYSLNDGNYKCVSTCLSSNKKYYDEDYKCIEASECTGGKVLDGNNKCSNKCDIESDYKFTQKNVNSIYECKTSCSGSDLRFNKPDYICKSSCVVKDNNGNIINSDIYVREDGECEKSCDPDSYATFGDPNTEGELICSESCSATNKYYYLADKICRVSCNPNDFIIENTNQCVTECGGDYPYKYLKAYDSSAQDTCVRKCTGTLPYTWNDGTCRKECANNPSLSTDLDSPLPYYLDSDKICLYTCPKGFSQSKATSTGLECINGCAESKFIYQEKCLETCPQEAPYSFEKTKECLYTCGSGFYKNDKICVDICPNGKPYDDGTGKCTDACPTNKNYYVKDIKPDEPDKQMHCLNDCPVTHPFFVPNENRKNNNACYENCPQSDQIYHVKTLGKIAKECKTECSDPTKYIGDNNQCLEKCPNSKPYYKSGSSSNIECFAKCPTDYYSLEGQYECFSSCNNINGNDYLIYEKEQICLATCKSNQYEYEDEDTSVKYCLDECKGELSITPENKCVKKCDSTAYLVKDPNSNKCICQKLYYYDETTGIMTCLNPTSFNDCRDNDGDDGYNIPVKNSEECLKTCKTILSSDGFCLEKYECPSNSVLTTESDYSQYCKCRYKFYKNEFKKNICLEKDEDCPAKFNYLIYETNECVERCIDTDYKYSLSGYCVKNCPDNAASDDITDGANTIKKTCKCSYNWILNDNDIPECFGPELECPQSKPLLVEDTKQCVAKCPNEFPIIFNGKCLSKCNTLFVKVTVLDTETALKQYGNYTCQCINLWFYDVSGNIICSDITRTDSSSCSSISNYAPKYLVKDTGQCIFSCPDLYHFKFNFDCFSDCENNANSYYKDNLEKKSNTECQCKNMYRTENNIIKCYPYEDCELQNNELYVVETEECIKGNICPIAHPILFNRKCYDTCPENSYYNPQTNNYCSCKYLWYKATNSITGVEEIICMKEEENCPESKPYLNTDTNECTDDYRGFAYIFNNKGYKNGCPLTTKKSATSGPPQQCECDETYGPWYKDDSDQNDYYYCGLDECPKNKPYKKSDTKECLYTCKDLTDYVVFKKICYPSRDPGCPGTSVKADSSNTCEYDPLLDSTDFDDFHSKFQNDILYYYDDAPDGGIVYEAYGVSTQLVGIGKNVEDYKNFTMKGNLTYIDFGKCMDKIYEANGLNDEDKIVLLKFDSVTIPENYLIHPVEYEAYSSKTGEKIDLSVCGVNDIVISYPISDLLNSNTKSLRSLADANNIKELFNLAKKLNDEYSNIDSFNPKSILYNDLCQECVIDGKDLILKDRVSYLYPENASLCESNCTFLSTDFEKERVYCKCTYKLEIIKDRKQSKYISNFTQEEIDNNQKGPTNFPILKCIKKFEVSHNGAFFYMIVVLILELVLCSLAFSLGYIIFEKKVSLVLYGKKEETENSENDKNNKDFNENDVNTEHKRLKIASSDRNINENKQANPPKNCASRQTEEDNLEIKIDQNLKTKNQSNAAILYRRNLKNDLEEPRRMPKDNHPLDKYFQDDIYSKYEKTSSEANYQRDLYDDENLLTILRKEKRNKELLYETAIEKDKENTPIIVLTFIVDKIYFTKTLFFTRKYNIFSALASLYILYHVLVLSLITMFFNVNTISKMFFEKNYPNISFYLLYGLISNIIAWFIYRLLGCLVHNNNKVINFIARWKKITEDEKNNENENNINNINNIINNEINNNDNNKVNVENEDYEVVKVLLDYRYNQFKKGVIVRLIIYYVIEWAILLFCFFYLCIFCSVYVSTKNEVFKTYGISLLEIFLIKIVYAVILGCLRSLSLVIESRKLYIAIKFFDFYLS